MKLLALTCIYDRPNVTRIFLSNMKHLGIETLAMCDTAAQLDGLDIKQAGVSGNVTLGRKWNLGLQLAMGRDWTHLLIIGDDDILMPDFINQVHKNADHPFIGISQCYIIEPKTKRAVYLKQHDGVSLGGGRVFQREVIESLNGVMFDETLNKNLDTSADMRLFELRLQPVIIDDGEPLVVSIKTKKNIWSFDNFKQHPPVDYDTILNSTQQQQQIKQLE